VTSSVKVQFRLQADEDDYPPVAVESVWATPVAERNELVIDNIPFFVKDATVGDRICVSIDSDGVAWFAGVVKRSGHSLLRVVFFDLSIGDAVASTLRQLGCSFEWFRERNLLAVDVPPQASLDEVQRYLASTAERGVIDYEEALLRP
jgi:Domain of unknown function (DUF4265)